MFANHKRGNLDYYFLEEDPFRNPIDHIDDKSIIDYRKQKKDSIKNSDIIYECKLSKHNSHERDVNILFNEKYHRYKIIRLDDRLIPFMTGVTSLIHRYFPEFNADEAIIKMRNGIKWNQKNPLYLLSNDEIKLIWKENAESSSRLGTIMHAYLETYFEKVIDIIHTHKEEELKDYFVNDSLLYMKEIYWPEPNDESIIMKQHMLDFLLHYPNLRPFRTEWRLYDREYLLAGTPDILFEDRNRLFKDTGELHLMDWKRIKELKESNKYEEALSDGVCNGYDNCNDVIYNVQLNLYKRILEKNYNVKIISMTIILFHPEKGCQKRIVDLMPNIIDNMLKERAKIVKNVISWIIE